MPGDLAELPLLITGQAAAVAQVGLTEWVRPVGQAVLPPTQAAAGAVAMGMALRDLKAARPLAALAGMGMAAPGEVPPTQMRRPALAAAAAAALPVGLTVSVAMELQGKNGIQLMALAAVAAALRLFKVQMNKEAMGHFTAVGAGARHSGRHQVLVAAAGMA